MSKYDIDLDINSRNSLSLIINMIDDNSKILEFGPANGRLTQYLKLEKKCIVDIVEIDEKSGEDASEYANISLIGEDVGNIENYKWTKILAKERYDYIIFADVLEHLYYPEKALNNAKLLLKDSGAILISIPNVAHNSIIIDLINDRFNYTEVGLLDNTHIRFFTYISLKEMIKNCELIATSEEAVYAKVSTIMPFSNYADLKNEYLEDILKNRDKGNVFQYVFKLQKEEFFVKNSPLISMNIDGRISDESVFYFKERGDIDFFETKCIRKKISYGKNFIELDLTKYENITELRFDPYTQKCVIKINSIYVSNDNEINYIDYRDLKTNAVKVIDNFYFFDTKDSQIEFAITNIINLKLFVDFTIYKIYDYDIFKEFFLCEKLNSILTDTYDEIVNSNLILTNQNESLMNKNTQLIKKNSELLDENTQLIKKNSELLDKNTSLFEKNKKLDTESIKMMEKNRILSDENINMINYINYKNNEIDSIKRSLSWKVTEPCRFLKNKTIQHLKKKNNQLFYKTLKSLKNHGLKSTIKKIQLYNYRKDKAKKYGIDEYSTIMEKPLEIYKDYQKNRIFKEYSTDIKTIAFYLPQFHQIKENDEWWGNGFTEWVNTKKAIQRFENHYQPRTPHKDIGFYDLSEVDTLKKQVNLAKQHGIYGFCFYYYWFSGKRLLEKPVDMLLKNKDIDINFCLCWANENWTRAWDGQDKEILIKQLYTEEDDKNFISDFKKYIDDRRYIKIDGRPVILVYNPGQIPNCEKTFNTWRINAREIGIGEILIFTCQTSNNTAEILGIEEFIDGEVEFPPHNMWFEFIGIRDIDLNGKEAFIYDYSKLVEILKKIYDKNSNNKVLPGSMMEWDNSARRDNNWVTFYNYSLKSFYEWISLSMKRLRENHVENERLLFINAWNEWAEGTYLEPDKECGYSNINTLSKALYELPLKDEPIIFNNNSYIKDDMDFRIAIQVHIFYIETIDDIVFELQKINFNFDCFISTSAEYKVNIIKEKFSNLKNCTKLIIDVYPNKGRDVFPFISQLKMIVSNNYKYCCHIHSKRTSKSSYGDYWRRYLFNHLFGSNNNVVNIIKYFENNQDIGLLFPETYPVLLKQSEWGGNKEGCQNLISKLNSEYKLPQIPIFPVGNMFWAKTDAIKGILDLNLDDIDFPIESGQLNSTIAHEIERIWVYIADISGYGYKKIFNSCEEKCIKNEKRITFFVHHSVDNIISNDDIYLIEKLHCISDELVFISNSNLSKIELDKVDRYTSKKKLRQNKGFDFGAWKDVIEEYGYEELEKFDKLVLANNSVIGPFRDMENIFNIMNLKKLDFWGITLFPFQEDGSYISKPYIPEHIQSYFQVFNKEVFTNAVFKKFWSNVKNYDKLIDVISECEVELTRLLSSEGFSYDVYITEIREMYKYLDSGAIPYDYPVELLTLGSPFIKKKSLNEYDFEKINRIKYWVDQLRDFD